MSNITAMEMNLSRYFDAGFPIIYFDTFEEEKAQRLIGRAAHSDSAQGKGLIIWNVRGLVDQRECHCAVNKPLLKTLEDFASDLRLLQNKVLVLNDALPLPKDEHGKRMAQLLKYLAQQINSGAVEASIVIVSATSAPLPPELQPYITVFDMEYLETSDIADVVRDFCGEQEISPPSDTLLAELASSFKGLTEFDIKSILSLAFAEDGELTKSSLKFILAQKKQIIQKSDILEMVSSGESLADVGGLDRLKDYLRRKGEIMRHIDSAEKFGVSRPKGILIAGMPGCGKSLCAKAAAHEFGVPLLRLDIGRLMGKYVGESEANLRKAIHLAEATAPCVLWIDELEKAFAGVGGEGGGAEVTTRLFGTFLTWLQEKKSLAFVVATANDLSKIPLELLRRGRFDELFYVGFPKREDREHIFSIHLQKRRPDDVKSIDVRRLADRSADFSGADIEGAVVDSVEEAFYQQKDALATDDVLEAIRGIKPMGKTMKDKCEELEKLYTKLSFKNAAD